MGQMKLKKMRKKWAAGNVLYNPDEDTIWLVVDAYIDTFTQLALVRFGERCGKSTLKWTSENCVALVQVLSEEEALKEGAPNTVVLGQL